MADAFGLSCCSFSHAFESELSRRPKVHHGDVPSLSHPSGKNLASLKINLFLQPLVWKVNESSKGPMFFSAKRDVFFKK
ncbi:MAG: hypothetical protein IJQ59_07535 [Bacteroidaceae bacterium]|nr:hypothetical protein [Bacteroidaceae bacterium]